MISFRLPPVLNVSDVTLVSQVAVQFLVAFAVLAVLLNLLYKAYDSSQRSASSASVAATGSVHSHPEPDSTCESDAG